MDIDEQLDADLRLAVARRQAPPGSWTAAGAQEAARRRQGRSRALGGVALATLILGGVGFGALRSGAIGSDSPQRAVVAAPASGPPSTASPGSVANLAGQLWDGRAFSVSATADSLQGCVEVGRTDLGCAGAATQLDDNVLVGVSGDRGSNRALLWGFVAPGSKVALRTEPSTDIAPSVDSTGAFAIAVPPASAVTRAVLVVSGSDSGEEYDLAELLGINDRSSWHPEEVAAPSRNNTVQLDGLLEGGGSYVLSDSPTDRLCLTLESSAIGCQPAPKPIVASVGREPGVVYGWAPPGTTSVAVELFSTGPPETRPAQLSTDGSVFILALPPGVRAGNVVALNQDGDRLWEATFTPGLPSFDELPDPEGPDPRAESGPGG